MTRYIIEFDMLEPKNWIYPNGTFNSSTNSFDKNHGYRRGGNSIRVAQKEISLIKREYSSCKPYNFVVYDCGERFENINPIEVYRPKNKRSLTNE